MTETGWLHATDPRRMLLYVAKDASERKLRLLGVACAHTCWHPIRSVLGWCAVGVAERYAEGFATQEELEAAAVGAREALRIAELERFPKWQAAGFAVWSAEKITPMSSINQLMSHAKPVIPPADMVALIREIFGNPFDHNHWPRVWPAAVTELAAAFDRRYDCAFALHDALLEAGHADLAEHFAKEPWHPKGCWVVDLILGKQ